MKPIHKRPVLHNREKIKKDLEKPYKAANQPDLINTNGPLQPVTAEHKTLSNFHGTVAKVGNILG